MRSRRSGSKRSEAKPENPKIYVRGLKSKYRENDIADVFERFGEITEIKLNTGYAFIEYRDPKSA